jgi:hypothetical protein
MAALIISIGGSWRYVMTDTLVATDEPPPPPPPVTQYLNLSGSPVSGARVTEDGSLNLPGSHAIYALEAPTDWTPTGIPRVLVTKWADAGNQRSYWWETLPGGAQYLSHSPTPGTTQVERQTPVPAGVVDGEWVWTRRTFTASNGQIQFSTSPAGTTLDPFADPREMAWTVRATINPNVPAAAVNPSTAAFTIGTDTNLIYNPYIGKIAQLVVTNAAGAIVFKLDPNNWSTGTTWTTSTGHTVTLAGAGASILAVGEDPEDPDPPDPPPPSTSGPMPIVMPSSATLRAAPRKLFAHYFTQYPKSYDNAWPGYYAQYNRPGGDPADSAIYGGWFTNKPANTVARPRSGDWQLEDMKDEVREAIAAGYDGFTMNVLALSGYHWERIDRMYAAAAAVDTGFKILLMPDAYAGGTADQNLLADRASYLATTYPNTAFKLADGRLVISPFMAEGRTPTWWSQWIANMNGRGHQIAFVPCFLNYGGNIANYRSICYGASVWGGRNPAQIGYAVTDGNDAHARGLIWMHPVAPQDLRKRDGIYDEACNTETMRLMFDGANSCGAEWAQMITWNDYSEQAEIAPSVNLTWAGLDLSAYYAVRWKLGAPTITKDTIYITHRIQPHAARANGGQTRFMALRGGSTPARDTIEVLTFLRAASPVTFQVGSGPVTTYTAPAGVHARLFPLANGFVSVRVNAPDGRVTQVSSPFEIRSIWAVEDLQYRYVSSGRNGTSTPG